MHHSDGWKLAQERMLRERLIALAAALQWGTKRQITWNARNLNSLLKEYLK